MENASSRKSTADFLLRLYITGISRQSTRAILNTRQFCTDHLPGRHHLEIIDLLEHPSLAAADQIIAAPTLVKLKPLPLRRFIGDMSNTARLLAGFGLKVPTEPASG